MVFHVVLEPTRTFTNPTNVVRVGYGSSEIVKKHLAAIHSYVVAENARTSEFFPGPLL